MFKRNLSKELLELYTLEDLLEENDLEQEEVVDILLQKGLIIPPSNLDLYEEENEEE